MTNRERFSEREWEELASALSGEKDCQPELIEKFREGGDHELENIWKKMSDMSDERQINVDNAWNKLSSRIEAEADSGIHKTARILSIRKTFIRVAAAILLLVGLGAGSLYLFSPDTLSRKIVVTTGSDQVGMHVLLTDGSSVYLNRNSKLVYHPDLGRHSRNVSLTGEAFFEISPNPSKPFIINAGNAKVRVVGTSFNVITNNTEAAVEVFVRTGKVMLYDNSGIRNLLLEPGYIGTMSSAASEKKLNSNRNYLAWQTRRLVYNGESLEIVLKDLKRVYNMDIVADDPTILAETWTTAPVDNKSQDTIIRLICTSFNLSYSKDGDIYHLARK